MHKKLITILSVILLFTFMTPVFAQDDASFESVCTKVDGSDPTYGKFPKCASSPNECASNTEGLTPLNCLFLEEPIGGEPGYDMYKISCFPSPDDEKTTICQYSLWHVEAIVGLERGPVQAILSFEEGKDAQGPFGLLYNYLTLIYKFMSGIIVAFVILIAIVGGIRMTTSAGNSDQFQKGRDMIIKAMIGMALWFLASLILYTINPTFFAF
ncbi:pilin [Patescibacteria group bacterium]|nr:pilin [Patescibacteria group bacterium]